MNTETSGKSSVQGKKILVVIPAYNASRTIQNILSELDRTVVDEVLVIDDGSSDDTLTKINSSNVHVISHRENRGYGASQKTAYAFAIEKNVDIVVMVHGDYQYNPRLVPAMAWMIASGGYDCILGSRFTGPGVLNSGMPVYKIMANRFLTCVQNLSLQMSLSEYHTGLRAFSLSLLKSIQLEKLSDDFIFDNQILTLLIHEKFKVGELSCPARYFDEASSISFGRSVNYGIGVLKLCILVLLKRANIYSSPFFRLISQS